MSRKAAQTIEDGVATKPVPGRATPAATSCGGAWPHSGLCQGCVLMMIRRCYQSHWWFRLVREPLAAGMRLLALVNGIRPRDYAARNPECHGCLRFIKAELEIRSATFRFLNGLIGRKFRTLRDSMLEEKDLAQAKKHAAEMMALLAENEADQIDGKG